VTAWIAKLGRAVLPHHQTAEKLRAKPGFVLNFVVREKMAASVVRRERL
jgi:hypothetical protein